ncbi:TetR/AcrR family transcriptional regulator [Azospirillum sp. sgz302134]
MGKGERTRERIVDAALERASVEGLTALSIGDLAAAVGMSKSGLFGHFGSKDALQEAVLDEMLTRFRAVVWEPASGEPPGVPRLRAVFSNWLVWVEGFHLPGGCPIAMAMVELDDRPGPLRDTLAKRQKRWMQALEDEFWVVQLTRREEERDDPALLAFELHGIVLGYGAARRLLRDPRSGDLARAAFEGLLARASGLPTAG